MDGGLCCHCKPEERGVGLVGEVIYLGLAVGGAELAVDLGRSCEGVLLAKDDADGRW